MYNIKSIRFIWMLLIFLIISHYLFYPEEYTAENLSKYCSANKTFIFISYISISLLRSLFFLPSTIFVIMGVVLFPNDPFIVLFISMLGIISGASFIYFSANFLNIEKIFRKNSLEKTNKIKQLIEKYGLFLIFIWAFIPIVPTDLICYIAGKYKMNYLKFILALFSGELILVCLYIWTGKSLMELLL
jgi:uncharacterized membrane protein YdjX (TVP38/TMEM64 family)